MDAERRISHTQAWRGAGSSAALDGHRTRMPPSHLPYLPPHFRPSPYAPRRIVHPMQTIQIRQRRAQGCAQRRQVRQTHLAPSTCHHAFHFTTGSYKRTFRDMTTNLLAWVIDRTCKQSLPVHFIQGLPLSARLLNEGFRGVERKMRISLRVWESLLPAGPHPLNPLGLINGLWVYG